MHKERVEKILGETFDEAYNETSYSTFIREIFHIKLSNENIPKQYLQPYKEFIKEVKLFGTYNDNEKRSVSLLAIHLNRDESVERARSAQREFVTKYIRSMEHDAALIAFHGDDPTEWRLSFITIDYNRKKIGGKIRIEEVATPTKRSSYLIGRNQKNHTAKSRFKKLLEEEKKPSLKDIKDSFSVEKVTEEFFVEYKKVFFAIRDAVKKQKVPSQESHEFTLQLLNRIMFMYFVAKKSWLNNKNFVKWYWEEYAKGKKDNSFYEIWLKQLFFKALNNRSNELTRLPTNVKEKISDFPYLNGGLFRENTLDAIKLNLQDDLFEQTFDFFEKYNFTVKEDLPIEQEVAVDPQMIGHVYEALAIIQDKVDIYHDKENEDAKSRKDWGIVYTPKVEVDFMCRMTVKNYLTEKIPSIPSEKFSLLLFGDEEEKKKAEDFLTRGGHWRKIHEDLDDLSVIDPACGSGAFLVGMLNVLTELYKRINLHLKLSRTDYQVKFGILQRSLYGVDVMPWAVHASELRLWLQLIVETEFKKEELRKHPLLPNLNFNLRIGDSLIQEIGDISFNIRQNQMTKGLTSELRKKLATLKVEKEKYFENSPSAKKLHEINEEENELFREIIVNRQLFYKNQLNEIEKMHLSMKSQQTLFGKIITEENVKENLKSDNKIKFIKFWLERLEDLVKNIDLQKRPFVWDIDFSEIFGEKDGFDIVIGNPPYVRQENISPQNNISKNTTAKDRTDYKEKIISSIEKQFPSVKPLERRSDLYIYFFFTGFGLLNRKGTLCFITSNSWLDVSYGKNLQEFLLTHVPTIGIFDYPNRSFSGADINTVITLTKAPIIKDILNLSDITILDQAIPLSNTLRFVKFRKKLEETLNATTIIEIEKSKAKYKGADLSDLSNNIIATDNYRIFPIEQRDLLKDGNNPETEEYEGNKWGGKFLRAPDVFFTVLKKGKRKLIKLGDISKISRGFTTGINDFFYLELTGKKTQKGFLHVKNGIGWEGDIEEIFLKPLIKSPKECESIIIDPQKLKQVVFLCQKEKKEIIGTKALEYINWGESTQVSIKKGSEKGRVIKGIHNITTVKSRKEWYFLPELPRADILFRQFFDKIFNFPINEGFLTDHTFYFINLNEKEDLESVAAILNSTLNWFMIEIFGRSNMGDGVLTTYGPEMKKLIILDPQYAKNTLKIFEKIKSRKTLSIFEEIGYNVQNTNDVEPLNDRLKLDNLIFEQIGLNEDEIKDVYMSVCELVKERLEKAKSLD